MNAIFNFSQGNSLVPKFVKERLNLSEIHLIVHSSADVKTDCKRFYIERDCQLGKFIDSDDYDDIAIDEDFLKKMAACESEVMKMMDRYQYTNGLLRYESRINLYHKQLKYWLNYLVKNNIDICFFAVIPHVVYDFILYSLCKELGIKVIMLYRLPVLPGKNVSIYVLSDIKQHIQGLHNLYSFYLNNPEKIALSERMSAYLDLKNGNQGKTYTGISKSNRNLKKYLDPQKYIEYFKYKYIYYHSWLKLWGKPIDLIERFIHKAQHSSNKKTSYYTNPDLSCPYIFVALHYQPECTTSPMGGMFVYQDLMLDILMKAIPEHIKIYVKAHPREGLGPILRERLRLDKRTLLIDPNLNSHRMIINSIAVATVTGTSGWEAFLSNKSVLMFGEYFYQDAPGVYKIKNLIDASNAIHDILNKSEEISDAMIMAFLMAVQDKTFPGWVDNRYAPISGISNQENAVSIANHIVDEIMTSA